MEQKVPQNFVVPSRGLWVPAREDIDKLWVPKDPKHRKDKNGNYFILYIQDHPASVRLMLSRDVYPQGKGDLSADTHYFVRMMITQRHAYRTFMRSVIVSPYREDLSSVEELEEVTLNDFCRPILLGEALRTMNGKKRDLIRRADPEDRQGPVDALIFLAPDGQGCTLWYGGNSVEGLSPQEAARIADWNDWTSPDEERLGWILR